MERKVNGVILHKGDQFYTFLNPITIQNPLVQ